MNFGVIRIEVQCVVATSSNGGRWPAIFFCVGIRGLLRAIAVEGNNTRGFCHISDCIRSAF
jgi:hypothetical protein